MRLCLLVVLAVSGLIGCGGSGQGGDGGLVVRIVSPDDGALFLTPETVHFECRASRSDGQPAPSANYEWRIEPAELTLFGQTASSQLPGGGQNVICKAEDPESGEHGEAEIGIEVGDAVVRITNPADGVRLPESFAGSGVSNAIIFTALGRSVSGSGGTYTWDIGPVSGLMGQTVLTSLPLGVHSVEVQFKDTEGNEAADAIELEVLSQAEWAACHAAEELCNGLDDNCNGQVDEGSQSCGVGRCARQMERCSGGGDAVCVPDDPEPEECNGQDDDCDGLTDELDGDMSNLCEEIDRICVDGHCERFEAAAECAACPCDQCGEGRDMEQCCQLPDAAGAGVICIHGDRNQNRCPVL